MAHYVHHVPGRLRLRLPRLKHNPAYAERLREGLVPLAGVLDVQSNLITGSLLIRYEPATVSAETLQAALPAPVPAPWRHEPLRGTHASDAFGLTSRLMDAALEKALTHSARVLLGALF